jgi:predicted acyltransferase (DUF342 family)
MRLYAALLLLLVPALFSCQYIGGKRINGDGVLATQQRQVNNFSGVEVKGGMDVFVSQGSTASLKIEGDQNLLSYIDVQNDNGVLEIGTKEGYNLQPKTDLKIYATAPVFNKLYLAGSGNIKSQTTLTNAAAIDAEIRGSGDIMLAVDAPTISADIAGSGNIILTGNTQNFKGSIRGSGDIKCFNLLSEKTDIDIAGSGDAEVFASKQLLIDIKGAGDVKYKGNPNVNQNIRGSGSVTKAG